MNQPSCRSEHDPNALSVDEARERVLAGVEPVSGHARLPLRRALGRVLSHAVAARLDVPPEPNSAMDGYALRHADLAVTRTLRVAGTSWAGRPFAGSVGKGETVRIMTGAVMPTGADTVVMQEEVRRHEDVIEVSTDPARGEFVRHPGDDVARGATVLPAGKRLGAADLGLLASQGFADVRVRRRVRVAFFSTGDELAGVGTTLASGQIHDSNRYTLYGLLREQDVEPLDLGVVRDDRDALRAAFELAARDADAIISTGGVSAGEADYVKEILIERGVVSFWKIAMRPGRPLTFGTVGDARFFGLPGNPVSVAVTFAQFVVPALQKMAGSEVREPLVLQATLQSRLGKAPGRRDFQRGILSRRDGRLWVATTGMQGSHVLSGMSSANCYIVLPEELTQAQPGDEVDVIPLTGTL